MSIRNHHGKVPAHRAVANTKVSAPLQSVHPGSDAINNQAVPALLNPLEEHQNPA
jgi:hypothetical protein